MQQARRPRPGPGGQWRPPGPGAPKPPLGLRGLLLRHCLGVFAVFILDLKFLNQFNSILNFVFLIESVITILQENNWMATIDLKEAYLHIPVFQTCIPEIPEWQSVTSVYLPTIQPLYLPEWFHKVCCSFSCISQDKISDVLDSLP